MRSKRGFTLIELVVILAVISILAALLLPTILGVLERSRLGRAESDVATISKVLKLVTEDTSVSTAGCLTDFSNLTLLTASAACTPSNAPHGVLPLCSQAEPGYICWNGPYITEINNDPWGRSYSASEDVTSAEVVVRSNGPDGIEDTTDDVTALH